MSTHFYLHVSQSSSWAHSLSHTIRQKSRLIFLQSTIFQEVFGVELVRLAPEPGVSVTCRQVCHDKCSL